MYYDLYYSKEARLASPNSHIMLKIGIAAVFLSLALTLFTYLYYTNTIYDVSISYENNKNGSDVVLENMPFRILNCDIFIITLKSIQVTLIPLILFFYRRAYVRNEGTFMASLGLALTLIATIHSFSLEEFYGIEFQRPIDSLLRAQNLFRVRHFH